MVLHVILKFYIKFYNKIKKIINDLSIFYKIFLGIIIIVVCIIGVSSLSFYRYSKNIYEDEVINNATKLVQNINQGFEDNQDSIEKIITSFYSLYADPGNEKLLLKKNFNNVTERYEVLKVVRDFFIR